MLLVLGCAADGTGSLPRLGTDATHQGRLASGQGARYGIALASGDYVEIAVEQHGIDVVVELLDPGGREILTVDGPTGDRGTETLFAVAERSGLHRLEVRPWSAEASGRYLLRVRGPRPASRHDRRRSSAARAFFAGERLAAGRSEDALRAAATEYQRALADWRAAREVDREAVTLRRLVRLRLDQGEVGTALTHCRRALELVAELVDLHLQAILLNECGSALRWSGHVEEAGAVWLRALEVAAAAGDRRERTAALHNLALLQRYRGEPWRALLLYDRALAGWRELEDVQGEAASRHNVAKLYVLLGRLPEALDSLQRALELRRRAGDRTGEAASLTAIGDVHIQSGRPGEARAVFEAALALRRAAGDRRGEAVTIDWLATADRALGRHDEALAGFRRALETFRRLGDRLSEAHSLLGLGETYEQIGRAEDALTCYDRAMALFQRMDERNGEILAHYFRARVERNRNDLATARVELEQAVRGAESLRTGAGSLGLRSSYFASMHDLYGLYLDLLVELHGREPGAGHDARALEIAERRRARSLLDSVLATAEEPASPPPADRAEAGKLARAIENLEAARVEAIASGGPRARVDDLEAELRARLLEQEKLEGPPSGSARGAIDPLDVDQIRRRVLDDDTLQLTYALGVERSFLFLLGRDLLETHVLPPRKEIEDSAVRLHGLLARSHTRSAAVQAQLAAAALGATLLGPVAERLGTARLLVVTEGALQYVPFGALRVPRQVGSGDGGELEPLIERHEIVHLPSASVLDALRRRSSERPVPPKLLAVLADPVFDPYDPRVERATDRRAEPATAPPGEAPTADLTRSAGELGVGGFERLPSSGREAEAILDLAPPGQRLAALGFDAGRPLILSGVLAEYRILHFATHALLHDRHAQLSGVVLSLVDREGRPQDGFLRAHEISRLHLPVELVVLSGCRTALGQEVRGEGLVGLTQGFFDAGAERVVVSLWEVSDQGTAELMRRFYRGLLVEGLAPAAALRAAQISMSRDPEWGPPSYWAAFTLQGEWS